MINIIVIYKWRKIWYYRRYIRFYGRMEVMMKITQRNMLVSLLGIAMVMAITSGAQAQWPTLDIAAIKEGISSKIELVKQSKIVTQTTQLAGKMNSTIGDAKASMSKFAGDTIEKAKQQAEKLQKEKERLEKQKEKIEKAKEKAEKAKEQYEKAQQEIAKAKQEVEKAKETVNDVKSQVDDAKAMVNEAKNTMNDAKATINDAKDTVSAAKDLAQDKVSSVQNKVDDVRSEVGGVTGGGNVTSAPSADDTFVEDYVAAYEAGINSNAKIYDNSLPATAIKQPQMIDGISEETVQIPEVMQNAESTEEQPTTEGNEAAAQEGETTQTSNTPISVTDDKVEIIPDVATQQLPSQSGKSFRRPFGANKQLSPNKVQEATTASDLSQNANKNSVTGNTTINVQKSSNQGAQINKATPSAQLKLNTMTAVKTTAGIKPVEAESLSNGKVTPTVLPQATPSLATGNATLSKTTPTSSSKASISKGFRQRATIKNNVPLDKGANLDIKQVVKLASYKSSQTLMFGAEDYIPDGVVHNGIYEETIIPPTLVEYCNIGVDKLQDPSVMIECLKKLIRHMSDSDSQVAAEGKSICNKIVAETIIAMTSESMQMKNVAANSKEQVSDKFDEQASSASTIRDDSASLALSNKMTYDAQSQNTTMTAGQIVLTVIGQLCGLTAESLGETGDTGEE